jgi:hypothetical protein
VPALPEPVETFARWAADQPGWTGRVFAHHTRRADGTCAGCGGYRPTRWPCLLIHIAGRTREIHRERGEPPADGRCPLDPAAPRVPAPRPAPDTVGVA